MTSMKSTEPSIKVDNVTVAYGNQIVLKDYNLVFKGSMLVQIMGPNGAGKTTLLRTILGLIKPIKGKVYVNQQDVTGNPSIAGKFIGYVPQHIQEQKMSFPISVWEFIENSLMLYSTRFPRTISRDDIKNRVKEVLELVDIPQSLWNKSFWKLSGGYKQRVLIARALIRDPPILLMDEPLSAVDPVGREKLCHLIAKLSRKKLIIVTCHDPTLLLPYTQQVVVMKGEYYVVGTPKDVLRLEILSKVYGGSALYVEKHIHVADSCR